VTSASRRESANGGTASVRPPDRRRSSAALAREPGRRAEGQQAPGPTIPATAHLRDTAATRQCTARRPRAQAAAKVRVVLGSQLDIDGDDALRTAMEIAAANVAVRQAKLAEMDGAPLDGTKLDL
jgi:hypothetical protein